MLYVHIGIASKANPHIMLLRIQKLIFKCTIIKKNVCDHYICLLRNTCHTMEIVLIYMTAISPNLISSNIYLSFVSLVNA